jgi:hypothetical protein
MGIMSVSAAIASMFLPETLGAPLPQTIDDAEQFGKHIDHCQFCVRRRQANDADVSVGQQQVPMLGDDSKTTHQLMTTTNQINDNGSSATSVYL